MIAYPILSSLSWPPNRPLGNSLAWGLCYVFDISYFGWGSLVIVHFLFSRGLLLPIFYILFLSIDSYFYMKKAFIFCFMIILRIWALGLTQPEKLAREVRIAKPYKDYLGHISSRSGISTQLLTPRIWHLERGQTRLE